MNQTVDPSVSPLPTDAVIPRPLDPHELIERSRPAPAGAWLWYVGGSSLLILLIGSWAGSQSPQLQTMMRVLGGLVFLGLAGGMMALSWSVARKRGAEIQNLQTIEELIQLRRTPEAAMWLQRLLSAPMRSIGPRMQALLYLSAVLVRYHRFEDATVVQNYLLDHMAGDSLGVQALRLNRAMCMLQEDRLVDADRAIIELRRMPESEESGGLALLEIYRDVKTGHPAEAIEVFTKKLPLLRRQLGHRLADAWALMAKAYDMVGETARAAAAYTNATLLAPVSEVIGRYPEVGSLSGRYTAAAAPADE